MKQLFYTILLLPLTLNLSGQNSSYPEVPFTELYHIEAEGDNVTSVGSCDKAMYSHDGGDTWTYFDVNLDIEDIAIVPGTEGKQIYMIDEDELYILDTDDESVTSTGITSNSLISGDFEGMKVKNGTMVIVGSISVFQSSLDDLNFTKVGDMDYGGSDRINDVELTDNFAWVSTRKGLIFKGDLGANTVELAFDFDDDLRNFAMGTDDIGYASFSGFTDPVKTTDGGATWNPFSSFSEISTLHAYGENVVISQNTNRLVISTDGALTSTYVAYTANTDKSYLEDLTFTADGTIYLSGESSTILKSSDFGLTYENLNPYPRAGITSIKINDNGKGIAIAGEDLILTTENNGNEWAILDYQNPTINNYLSDCVSTNDGSLLIMNDEGIIKVEDGITVPHSDEVLNTIMYDSVKDYFIGVKRQGSSFIVRKSVDGGVTWESKTVLNDFGYAQALNKNGTIVISASEEEYILSKDDGETWEVKTNTFGNRIFSAALYGDVALMSAGNVMYKSTDGFETFSQVSSGYGQGNIQMYSEDHYIFTSAQNFVTTVKESKNGGETWNIVDSYCSQTFCSNLQGDRFWMGQRGGHINFTELDLSTATNETTVEKIEIHNNILQNGDRMTLHFNEKINGIGAIIAQSGQTIDQFGILNESFKNLTINNLSPGIYFLKIESESKVHQGKFVVL